MRQRKNLHVLRACWGIALVCYLWCCHNFAQSELGRLNTFTAQLLQGPWARSAAFGHRGANRRETRANAAETSVTDSVVFPRHPSNTKTNDLLEAAEKLANQILANETSAREETWTHDISNEERVYANTYVNLGSAKVVGFDYDYTLVSYKPAILHLIYNLAKEQLVSGLKYPKELVDELPGYDEQFAIRGLAVDLDKAWICMLTLRYRVSIAFYGRERVDPKIVARSYRSETGSGILPPEERKKRLKPLNDLFSTAEACLLADVVQWFRNRNIPFDARSVVTDVLAAITKAHVSGELHRTVCENLETYIEPDGQHLLQLLDTFRAAGKKLMLVSNSPFWFVNSGMVHVCGEDWRSRFDVVVVSAGKPGFYTGNRPFREVSTRTGRIKFKPITSLSPDEVYCQGSLGELVRLMGWDPRGKHGQGSQDFDGSSIIYIGDSVFADLVEARRLYGWTTGAIIREVSHETAVQKSPGWQKAWRVLQVLTLCARQCQKTFLTAETPESATTKPVASYSTADTEILDSLEDLAADWRSHLDALLNPNFGSIFRTSRDNGQTAQPSLFARCLQRHVDFYTSKVENLRLYSTDHRFYPADYSIGVLHEVLHLTDPLSEALSRDPTVE
eukprot:Skav219471  [mRNA]  locus=scaffold2719:19607:21463:+ [translate_table: standard]